MDMDVFKSAFDNGSKRVLQAAPVDRLTVSRPAGEASGARLAHAPRFGPPLLLRTHRIPAVQQ